MEAELFTVLKTVAPRVYPDVAPEPMPVRPFVTYQQVGGETLEYLENTPPNLRNARIQVNVWAVSRIAASALALQVEDAMRAAAAFQARPLGAMVADYDPDTKVYGARQDFTVWAPR